MSTTGQTTLPDEMTLTVEGACNSITIHDASNNVIAEGNPVKLSKDSITNVVSICLNGSNKPKLDDVYYNSTAGTKKDIYYNHKPFNLKDKVFSVKTDGNSLVLTTQASFKFQDVYNSGVRDLHFVTSSDEVIPKPYNVTYQLGNCTSSLTDSSVPVGKEVNIILTCESGYYFETTPTVVASDHTINFTVSSDKTSANITFTPTSDFIISAKAKAPDAPPVTSVSSFIDVFLPDSSQLDKIKEIRWTRDSDGNGSSADINNNISAMYQTFINIPSDGVKNCKIAGYDTNITIPFTNSVLCDIKSDEVMFEEKYHSAMDYEPHTKCHIYLPFCGLFQIDTDLVIGKTIQLVYTCNVYTCDCECKIYSDHNLIQTENGKFGFDYPFRSLERTKLSIDSSNYFSDLVPKIIITRHNFVSLDELRPVSYSDKCSNVKGYFEADSIKFDAESLSNYPWITKEDVDNIERALRSGVEKPV